MPPFDAEYGAIITAPVCALDDEMLTMRPHFAVDHVGQHRLRDVERAGEVDPR